MRAHLLNALLAVVFSILIWSAVGAQLSEVAPGVKVDFVIEVPPDVTVTYQGRHSTGRTVVAIEVDVRGPREVIARLSASDISARLALTHESTWLREALAVSGSRTVELRPNVRSTRPGLEIVDARLAGNTGTNELDVTFSQVVDWEPRLKKPETIGSPAPGFRPGRVTLERTRVVVRGPASVRDNDPGPYAVEPVDVGGERAGEPIKILRSVLTPPGVTCDTKLLVTVEIVPDPEVRSLTFPIHVLVTAQKDGGRVDPLGLSVVPRTPRGEWYFDLPLRGSVEALDALKLRLDTQRLNPTRVPTAALPLAYVRAESFPHRPGEDDVPEVEIVGLPEGITYPEKVKFPIRTVEKQ